MAETDTVLPPDWLIAWADLALKRAKLSYDRIERVFPPHDGLVEVLAIDHYQRPMTVFLDGKGDKVDQRMGW